MSSIIPEYNYDIFISYRQKDNKYDGWVTEFVNNLKKELEATFKEEISVYFDKNPHDGLLETHDVDESLKEKLKCLVFIPIISRTYCDPKSFAWEHEFKAFVEQASKDQFGLKVKLPNGNVASRVLPVRIHDLNPADIKLCESILGRVLRGVEFIYAEPGVNRPLKPDDDEKINLNKAKYRNQINKVGNAIDEIISGLKAEPTELAKAKILQAEPEKEVKIEDRKKTQEKPIRSAISKLFPVILITTILVIATIIAYPKIFRSDTLDRLRTTGERIPVAIFPFQNMTNDTRWDVWQEGIQFSLIASLSNYSKELIVSQAESISGLLQSQGLTDYASLSPSAAKSISKKLGVKIYIIGNISLAPSTIRLNARLVNTKTNESFKSYQIDGAPEEIISLTDSLARTLKDLLILSKLEGKVDLAWRQEISTNSPEAYEYLIHGNKAFFKNRDYPAAVNMYSKAIAADSNLFLAAIMLSWSYLSMNKYEEAHKWCLKVYNKRDKLSMPQKLYANYLYACYFETNYESIKYLKQLLEIDDQNPATHYDLGNNYRWLNQYDNAIPEYEKSLEIYNEWGSKPNWIYNYTDLGIVYHKTGQFRKERKLYKEAEKYYPEEPVLIYSQAILSLSERDTSEANRYISKIRSYMKEQAWSEARISRNLANIYYEADFLNDAEKFYREALCLESDSSLRSARLAVLAYFLIDTNRNIDEGLEFIDKALVNNPENYEYLDTKGWGLYKQGKYQEALDILQKSWDIRREKAIYNHDAYLHLEAARKAVAGMKNN